MKYYAVQRGVRPGVYETWDDCRCQVIGVQNASFKSFTNYQDALAFVNGQAPPRKPAEPPQYENFYAVAVGHHPGVYTQWSEASAQVQGFHRAKHRKFSTRAEAELFMRSQEIRTEQTNPSESGEFYSESTQNNPRIASAPCATKTKGEMQTQDTGRTGISLEKENIITVYTDGSSRNNGQTGARAGVGVYFGKNDPRNISEPLKGIPQTNQRAELTAIGRAFQTCPVSVNVRIISDSSYAIKCVTKWYTKWEANGWRNAAGAAVVNRDIIQEILVLMRNRDASGARTDLIWVRGHSNDEGNEAADHLAVEGSKK